MSGCFNSDSSLKDKCKCPHCLDERLKKVEDTSKFETPYPYFLKLNQLEELVNDFIKSANGRIEKLQNRNGNLEEIIHSHTSYINSLEKSIDLLETSQLKSNRKPYKCPVCDGTGKDKDKDKLVAEPYDEAIKILVAPPCHVCKGEGILWG